MIANTCYRIRLKKMAIEYIYKRMIVACNALRFAIDATHLDFNFHTRKSCPCQCHIVLGLRRYLLRNRTGGIEVVSLRSRIPYCIRMLPW